MNVDGRKRKAESEPESEPAGESESESERENERETERKVKIESEGEGEGEGEGEERVKIENESEGEGKLKIENEGESEGKIKIENEGEAKGKVKIENRAEGKIKAENERENKRESENDEDENENESENEYDSENEDDDYNSEWEFQMEWEKKKKARKENLNRDEESDYDEDTPDYRWQLLKTLQSVQDVSSYAYGSSLHKFCSPTLNVHGVGKLNLPLCEDDVKTLVARCALAPFGRGEKTILDPTVRNTWQISPTEFTIENESQWEAFVDTLTEQARLELGFTNAIVEKKLYKLLVYEQGGFFLPHRDSEKDKGMFASLIIILPSDYEGGQLVIRHNGSEKEFDFGGDESSHTINYAAFYADCEHEVRAITRGHRLCLVYNIINTGQDPVPPPSDDTALVKQTADIIQRWESDPDGPIKLVYLLEHRYTPSSLSFRNLKGHDRVVAQLMKQVERSIGVVLGLASMEWSAKTYLEDEQDEFDFGNMIIMAPVINVNGGYFASNGTGIFTRDQVLNRKLLNTLDPEEENFMATGNEGTEIDCQYEATGLVFCPKKNWPIMKWDLMGSKLSIAKMAEMTVAEGVLEQAQALLKSAALKQTNNPELMDRYSGKSALLLKLLASLRQLNLVDVYLDALRQNIIRVSPYPNLSSEIVRGCSELGWTELAPAIRQYVDEHTRFYSPDIARYFHSLAFSPIPNDSKQRQSRSDLIDYILNKFKGIGEHYSSWPIWIEILHHLGHHSMISAHLKKLATKKRRDDNFVESILPIIKTAQTCLSSDSNEASIQPSLVDLIDQAISILNEQIAQLHPAVEWERKLQCECEDCEKVKTFAHSPTVQTEQLTVDCNNWEKLIKKWVNVKVVRDTVKKKGAPVAKKMKPPKRTVVLTKLPLTDHKLPQKAVEKQKKNLKIISYLQSLPCYCAAGAKQ